MCFPFAEKVKSVLAANFIQRNKDGFKTPDLCKHKTYPFLSLETQEQPCSLWKASSHYGCPQLGARSGPHQPWALSPGLGPISGQKARSGPSGMAGLPGSLRSSVFAQNQGKSSAGPPLTRWSLQKISVLA